MKLFKKALSVILCVQILICVAAPAFAQGVVSSADAQLREYLELVIPRYIQANSITVEGNVYVSNEIDYYDFESGSSQSSIYFVISGEHIVGRLCVYDNNGYASTFTAGIAQALDNCYTENTPLALGYINETSYLYTSADGLQYIDGVYNSADALQQRADIPLVAVTKDFAISVAMPRATVVASKVLNVGHLHSGTGLVTGNGLCWAACVAMKVNYQMNSAIASANAVVNALGVRYPQSAYGNPEGTTIWIERAFLLYGCGYIYTLSELTSSEVYQHLNNGKPIMVCMVKPNVSVGHAVLIEGVAIYNNGDALYYIDDPDLSTQQTAYVLNGDSFSYYNYEWVLSYA